MLSRKLIFFCEIEVLTAVSGKIEVSLSFFLSFSLSFFLSLTSSTYHSRFRELLLHLIALKDIHTHKHTHPLSLSLALALSVGLLWTSDRPFAETLYLTTHNTDNRQTSMPPAGFGPAIPASERPQTVRSPESAR